MTDTALEREAIALFERLLDIPEADLKVVALRLASLLTAMEAIERELGPLMDKTEPIPPVFPQEPAD